MMSDLLPDLEQSSETSALLRLLNQAGARRVLAEPAQDTGLADAPPYPFLAIVKQNEMRTALILSVINPAIGGVLLIGPRGTGKTTAVRSLSGILPDIPVSMCAEGCLPDDMADDGTASVCPECAAKLKAGEPIARLESVRLVELPLNARIEDVVGGINERIAVQQNRVRLERGILSRADQNLLYIDEINLLDDVIVDAILDAAAQGSYTVRRGAMAGTYRSRFVLIGSMNPEEGRLRPQIMDRFGLRVIVRGLTDDNDRMEVYQRVHQYRTNPRQFITEWAEATAEAREEIMLARELLKAVRISDEAKQLGLEIVQNLKIDSHRAEYTLFESARAHAAADGRELAATQDIQAVAKLALRQRQSQFMMDFFDRQSKEDVAIESLMTGIMKDNNA
jgi:magnesium chelatase subunit I